MALLGTKNSRHLPSADVTTVVEAGYTLLMFPFSPEANDVAAADAPMSDAEPPALGTEEVKEPLPSETAQAKTIPTAPLSRGPDPEPTVQPGSLPPPADDCIPRTQPVPDVVARTV